MGEEAGVCFNCIPSCVAFLSGPLQDGQEEIKVKQRAQRQARQMEDDAEEEKPEDVKGHTERGVDHLSAHEKNVEVVLKTLTKSVDSMHKRNKAAVASQYGDEVLEKASKKLRKGAAVCAVNLLYNPKSFTQTVENMFHYSYLVKKGDAVFKVREKEEKYKDVTISKAGPIASTASKRNSKRPPATQAVVTLTMKNWRDMIDAYDVEESSVPHRKGSKMKKTTPRGAVKNEE
jgi:non-structural maintenance of chromosomes element 4